MGQAHQAREDHGCKRHDAIKHKDIVIHPVKKYTLYCGHQSCPFRTGDHIAGNLVDDHRWLMVIHFEMENDAPPLVMVEGSVDKVSWGAFLSWYSWSYWGPRKMNLWLDIMHVFEPQPEQPPKQEQQVGDMIPVDQVTFKE